MTDFSHLDRKYFIDGTTYNCPFCNRNNVIYKVIDEFNFDWNADKTCYGFIVRCSSCNKDSMHLSYKELIGHRSALGLAVISAFEKELDQKIFFSVPTSFFTLDSKIPRTIREIISEAEGCLKSNFLTGASSCTRKAIYELTVKENCIGKSYEKKIKFLKKKYPNTDPEFFDTLSSIQGMTSNKIHEQSWEKWDSNNLKIILETLKAILHDIYVLPEIKKERANAVKQLKAEMEKDKNQISKLN